MALADAIQFLLKKTRMRVGVDISNEVYELVLTIAVKDNCY